MDGYHGHKLLKSPNLPGILQQQLNQQRTTGRFCDVKLKLQGLELNAHYCVLAALSPFVSAQVQSTSEICLPPLLTPKGVGPLIEWMYTSELTLSQENLLDVSFAAGYFQVEAVAKLCQTFQQNIHLGVGTSQSGTGIHGECARASEEQGYDVSPVGEDRNVTGTAKSSGSQTDVQSLATVRVKTEQVTPDPWTGETGNMQYTSAPGYASTEGSTTSPQLSSNLSPGIGRTNSSTPIRCDTPATPAYLSSAADSMGHLACHSGNLGLPEGGDTNTSSPTTGPRHDTGYIYAENQAWKDQTTDVNLVSSSVECAATSVSPHESGDNETASMAAFANSSAAANPSTPSGHSQIRIVAVVGSCRKLFYGQDFSVQTSQPGLLVQTDQSGLSAQTDQSGLSAQTDQSGLSVQTDQSELVDTTCYGTLSGSSEGANAVLEVTENVTMTAFQTSSSAISEDDHQQLPSWNVNEDENEALMHLVNDEAKAKNVNQNQATMPKQDGENVAGAGKLGSTQATSTTYTGTSKDSNGRDSHVRDGLSKESRDKHVVSPCSRGFIVESREQEQQQEQRDYIEGDNKKQKRVSSESVDTEASSPKGEVELAKIKTATSDGHGSTIDIKDAPIHDASTSASVTAPQKETEDSSGIEITFVAEGDQKGGSSVVERKGNLYKTNQGTFLRETLSVEPDDRRSSPRLNDLASTAAVSMKEDVQNKHDKKKRKAKDRHESSSEAGSPTKKKQHDAAALNLSENRDSSPPRSSSKKHSRKRTEDKQKDSTSKRINTDSAKMRSSSNDSSRQEDITDTRGVSSQPDAVARIRRQLCHQPVPPPEVEKVVNCYFCCEQFNSEEDRVRHLQSNHPGEIPYRCGFCSRGFLNHKDLSAHITTHKGTTWSNPFQSY
uniref:BTB domain-containing protein n=1 Tax=Branchiostoma floridae TaxID=7739 RepID=C3ZKT5_BRAFL|eukprot:XP_002590825.1 hypothetical protein BRAFLDRAFT_125725 [Branchiostoma floridae]